MKKYIALFAVGTLLLFNLCGCVGDMPSADQGGGTTTATTTEAVTTTTTETVTTTTQASADQTLSVQPREGGVLTDAEKTTINEILYDTLLFPMRNAYNNYHDRRIVEIKDFKGTVNLFEDPKVRAHFAWQVLIEDWDVPRVWEIDENGEAVTGKCAVKVADYEKVYRRVFGAAGDVNDLLEEHWYVQKGDTIYGAHVTGWGMYPYMLKAVSFDRSGEIATLTMDVVSHYSYYMTSDGKPQVDVDYETMMQLKDPARLTYPDGMVYAKATLTLRFYENGYAVESFVLTEV